MYSDGLIKKILKKNEYESSFEPQIFIFSLLCPYCFGGSLTCFDFSFIYHDQ
jgi:hypothetical protein